MRRFAFFLSAIVGCAAPEQPAPGLPQPQSAEEWLRAIEKRYADAGSVTIRAHVMAPKVGDGNSLPVEASFKGDERCRVTMGPIFIVCDGRTWFMDSIPHGRVKCGPIGGKAEAGGGEGTLVQFVRGGFGGAFLADAIIGGARADAVAFEARMPAADVIEYELRSGKGTLIQRVRFDRRTLVVLERSATLGADSTIEKWETTFDPDLPDSLFVVPEEKK